MADPTAVEVTMPTAKPRQFSIRLDDDVIEEVEAEAPAIARKLGLPTVSRAAALAVLIREALDARKARRASEGAR